MAAAAVAGLARVYQQPVGPHLGAHRPTGGALQADRVRALFPEEVFVGSGANLYALGLSLPPPTNVMAEPDHEGARVSKPMPFSSKLPRVIQLPLPHKPYNEIMCLSVRGTASSGQQGRYRIACADSSGFASLAFLSAPSLGEDKDCGAEGDGSEKKRPKKRAKIGNSKDRVQGVYEMSAEQKDEHRLIESGYVGVDLSPFDEAVACVVSHWEQRLTVFKEGKQVSSHGTSFSPNKAIYVQDTVMSNGDSIIATTESNMVTIYDVRTSKGMMARMTTGVGQALALTQAGKSHIAAGGTDRSLFIFDTRKWSKIARIQGITKYEITGLRGSSRMPGAVYVSSLDHEILLANWTRQKGEGSTGTVTKAMVGSHLTRQGLRGDSRWIGVDVLFTEGKAKEKSLEMEDFVGMTDTGRVYLIRESWRMAEADSGDASQRSKRTT